jgi:hypothetical protein
MEVPQGNSLCSYFKQVEMSFFLLQNWRTSPAGGGVIGTSGRGRMWGKGVGG